MSRALLPSIAPGTVLGVLIATGLLLPALPVLGLRMVWLLLTNPIRLR